MGFRSLTAPSGSLGITHPQTRAQGGLHEPP